ncbi:MAG: hypothetical protein M3Y06_02905 [Actinomycetota bacterium]|nr:hypothetical protein [Actinomycetota bacterium]
MLHLALYGLLAVIIAAGLFLVASRFLPAGEQIAPPLRDEPPWELPADRMLASEDVDSIRLPVALRGYRFAETDILLDRLAGELRVRDLEIAKLKRIDVSAYSTGDPNAGAPVAVEDFWREPTESTGDAPQPPPSDDDETPVTDEPPPPPGLPPVEDLPAPRDDQR